MTRLTFPMTLRWRDVDAFGHVNNAAYLSLLEEVRIRELHSRVGAADASGKFSAGSRPHAVVARHEIDYLVQLPWTEEPVLVDMWVSRIGTSSCEICHQVRSSSSETIHAQALTTVVYLDTSGQPRDLNREEKTALETMWDAPLRLRAPAKTG